MAWDIAERLDAARQRLGWSQSELARQAGLNQINVWKILHGEKKRIAAETVRHLAHALGVTTDYLLGMDTWNEDTRP